MTLLQPAALAFAALAPVIVVLYLLKLRRQPAQVSTLMFWQRVTADNRRRALFQRLRQVLSLLLHLLIFTLLLLALARPEFRRFPRAAEGAGAVVILDCRARMQARGPDGRPCFAAALDVAESYLRRASSHEPAALVAVEFAPRVVVGFSKDEKPLLDGLATLGAHDAGGRLDEAIRAGGDLLAATHPGGRLVVITDRAPAAGGPPVELRLVGGAAPRENVAVTRLAARPLPNSPETDEVLVETENFGPSRQSGSLELAYDGAVIDVKPFDLAPGERRTDVYPTLAANRGLANARGWLSAHLALPRRDAHPLDDDAYAVLPPPPAWRVLLVSRGNLYLESLLKADAAVRYELLAPEGFKESAAFDAVIFDGFLPPGFARMDHLPRGNYLFLGRTPFDVPGAAPADRPAITDQDRASPVLRLVDLRDVLFFRAAALALPDPSSGWRFAAPARALDRPLIVTGERPGQRVAAFAFGATDSELPLRVAFPLLVHNTLTWLSGRDDPAAGASPRAGEPIALPAGTSVWTHPQIVFAPLPPGEWTRGPAVWQPASNGFYLRRDAEGRESWVAVNTGDRAMSSLNAEAPVAPPAANAAAPAVRFPEWAPWAYLALAGFALGLAEWWSFHRRRTE